MSQPMPSSDYLAHVVTSIETNPYVRAGAKTMKGVFLEAAKMELRRRGLPTAEFDYSQLKPELDRIRNREDCAEFGIPALIRMLKEYRGMMPPEVVTEIEDTLVGFRYWLDEPGEINACYFTENHQPLYHSAEYRSATCFQTASFPQRKDGRWHKEHGLTFPALDRMARKVRLQRVADQLLRGGHDLVCWRDLLRRRPGSRGASRDSSTP